MSPDAIRHQAEAFVSWAVRAALPAAVAWRRWVEGKEFSPATAAAIEREVRAVRIRAATEDFLRGQTA